MSSDRDLVGKILERDARAFEALLERYEEPRLRHLLRFTRDDAAVQDLVQEVFLRVWTRAAQWDGRWAFRAWLYRIATNLALNHLRTLRRRHELPLEIEDDEDEGDLVPAWMVDASALRPDAAAETAEEWERFRGLVDALPDAKREVFRLVHEMEMTVRDAADELGISASSLPAPLPPARSIR